MAAAAVAGGGGLDLGCLRADLLAGRARDIKHKDLVGILWPMFRAIESFGNVFLQKGADTRESKKEEEAAQKFTLKIAEVNNIISAIQKFSPNHLKALPLVDASCDDGSRAFQMMKTALDGVVCAYRYNIASIRGDLETDWASARRKISAIPDEHKTLVLPELIQEALDQQSGFFALLMNEFPDGDLKTHFTKIFQTNLANKVARPVAVDTQKHDEILTRIVY